MKNGLVFIGIFIFCWGWYSHNKKTQKLIQVQKHFRQNVKTQSTLVPIKTPRNIAVSMPSYKGLPYKNKFSYLQKSSVNNISSRSVDSNLSVKPKSKTPGLSAAPPTLRNDKINQQYDPEDLELLKQAQIRAQNQGSKVAYIGQVEELYAFEPRFFRIQKEINGGKTLIPQPIESYQAMNSATGASQFLVQREPYAVLPNGGKVNYEVTNYAIIRATDDGATLINIVTPKIDRSYLQESIRYARSKGIVVVTVSAQSH